MLRPGRTDNVEAAWRKILTTVGESSRPEGPPLLEAFTELGRATHVERQLRQLFPWTGMRELHYSKCTKSRLTGRPAIDLGACRSGGSTGWWFSNRRSARYSYRYFSVSASACSMSAIVSSGIRNWASVTSAEVGWASVGSHCSGFQAALRRSALGQCG